MYVCKQMCSVIIINKLLMVLINFRRILRKEYLKFYYFKRYLTSSKLVPDVL